MAGNVFEWVEDWWYCDSTARFCDNCTCDFISHVAHAIRGSSFHWPVYYLANDADYGDAPLALDNSIGARCAR
jgi:hypothetical protein